MSPPELEGTEDAPLVGQEKTSTGRSRMVFGAAMFIIAMTLSATLGYVYAHKEHFPIRRGDPSHTRVNFPNQKDVQRLLELLQENCRSFFTNTWTPQVSMSIRLHLPACCHGLMPGDVYRSFSGFQRAEVAERGQFGSRKHPLHPQRMVPLKRCF